MLDPVSRRRDPRDGEQSRRGRQCGDRGLRQRAHVRAAPAGGQAVGRGEAQKLLAREPFSLSVTDAFARAYALVAGKMKWDAERRAGARRGVRAGARGGWPSSRWPAPRRSSTRPRARKRGPAGCFRSPSTPRPARDATCASRSAPTARWSSIRQDDAALEQLRRNWAVWQRLPDTDDRFVNVSDVDEGIGVLSSLLLKKATYRSMVGGDGACMGCGEKTAVHLIVSSIFASMQPRVQQHIAHLDELITALDAEGARAARLGRRPGGRGQG